MGTYKRYITTGVGSYSVPRWYESLEKPVEFGDQSGTLISTWWRSIKEEYKVDCAKAAGPIWEAPNGC